MQSRAAVSMSASTDFKIERTIDPEREKYRNYPQQYKHMSVSMRLLVCNSEYQVSLNTQIINFWLLLGFNDSVNQRD